MRRPSEVSVGCPHCGAQPGQRCIVIRPGKRWGRPATYAHAQRAINAASTALLSKRPTED